LLPKFLSWRCLNKAPIYCNCSIPHHPLFSATNGRSHCFGSLLLEVRVCSAFWYDTPAERKSRLKLESELINRWQSPFNKENWQRWGQPFGKI
ncbi:MAG: hypothetical protein QNJ32_30710, partial [Xenococcaceae cyanobacterium MO_167.B27]|nr:hypothetical protein [Xenococcaceae cyanobacterium MO_167.B27]